jgi:hypothetical protein
MSMASGEHFDIRHPEMILLGRTSVRLHSATVDDENEKCHEITLMLMETIAAVEAAEVQ